MPVMYETVQDIEEYHFPRWDYTWPGYDGCSPRPVYTLACDAVGASHSQAWYEPDTVQVNRDERHLRGYHPGIPPYRFTPRSVSTIKQHVNLLRRLNGTNGYNIFKQFGIVSKAGGASCIPQVQEVQSTGPFGATWYDVTHTVSLPEYVVNEFDQAEVDDAISSVQADAANEALTSYDVLTDIAEAREIPQLVGSVSRDLISILGALRGRFKLSDLRAGAFITPRQLLKSSYKGLKALGDRWMEYRYGIMPLAYSYRDIVKTTKRGESVTTRKCRVISPKSTGVSLPSASTDYIWKDIDGNIRISATVFQYFSWSSAARLAGLGLNPLATIWELIPYSFVIDWFVNVGDYITRKTSRSMAKMHWACISRRQDYTERTWVHYHNSDKTVTYGNRLTTPWYGSQPPATPSRLLSRPEESQLWKTKEVQAYDRWLYPLDDAQLTINPSLNWRRLVDSAVMANNQLGALNRFLKGFRH